MVKELLIALYLLVFKGIFNFFKLFPLKNKVTFVVSFGQNAMYIYEEMQRREVSAEVVFLCKQSFRYDSGNFPDAKAYAFETLNVADMLKSIYHLATSDQVIIDNYYGCLSAIEFKEGVECIQVWHAAGAIKLFGLRDRSVPNRSMTAQQRFVNVYKKMSKIVVGSEAMAKMFVEAFDLPFENMLRTGVPRTDLFYDKKRQLDRINHLMEKNDNINRKKIILYAPTYRDDQLDYPELKLDLHTMQQELGEEYVLFLKLHPAIKNQLNVEQEYPGFAYDFSYDTDINDLMLVADLLITDYSSAIYEYALLNRPMLFYPYDLKSYEESRGLWEDYHSSVPGPVVFSTSEIIEHIQEDAFNMQTVEMFAQKWNRYSKGNASQKLVDYLLDEKEADVYETQRETL